MNEWPKWTKTEPARLACYVHSEEVARVFGPPVVSVDLRRDHIGQAVRLVYDHLAAQGIPYVTSLIDFADYRRPEQVIRTPAEVRAQGGNCLELALLFAALCQRVGLVPLLVLLEQHALVAVRLDDDTDLRRATRRPGPHDAELLSGGMLPAGSDSHDRAAKLAEWVERGRCVLVECTGMASGSGGRTFEDASRKGLTLLTGNDGGALTQVVDVTYFHLLPETPYRPYRAPERAHDIGFAEDVVLGQAAVDFVTGLMAAQDTAPATPSRWNAAGLQAMRAALPRESALDPVLEDLSIVLSVAAFVLHWMPHALTSGRLRAALVEPFGGVLEELRTDDAGPVDHLAHVYLNRPVTKQDRPVWTRELFRFVVALARSAGLDLDDNRLRSWAYRQFNVVVANEVLDEAKRRRRADRRADRWRLRISLHGSPVGGWPEAVVGWLFDDGRQVRTRSEPCEPNQTSAELAIGDLRNWAEEFAVDAGDQLKKVEIAVPTSLLARWRPEETRAGRQIGVNHDVVVRWSERLSPAGHLRRLMSEAPRRWDYIDEHGAAGGLDWLESDETLDIEAVREQLENGTFLGAMGLRFPPEQRDDLLETLLLFSPVLIWPDSDTCPWDGIDEELRKSWALLPSALANAYRARWNQRSETPALAVVRAVWDDREWLAFCRDYLRAQPSLRRKGA